MAKKDQSNSVEKLRHHLESNNIKYLIPSYVDMHGVPKTKMVPIAHLEKMLGGSEFFTGAALDGVPCRARARPASGVGNDENSADRRPRKSGRRARCPLIA